MSSDEENMHPMQAPLAIVEQDDEEFQFYASEEEMLSDRGDTLWGERYRGIDSAGRPFSLVRRERPRRWWHGLLGQDTTRLAAEPAPFCSPDELCSKLSRFLNHPGTDAKELIRIGLAREKTNHASEDLLHRIERFERNVATCLCAFPLLFAAQCVLAALAAPTFGTMFADFGAMLPWPSRFLLNTWGYWAAFGVIVPAGTLILARKAKPNASVLVSTAAGLVLFAVAQLLTAALFLPVLQLGAVANGK